ncbi:MAG: hypothetical protein K2Y71_15455 [Xanthobacteraceae bacterium]|nr:hypothetical protein [Xanthobacteraceae bacterium]
MREFPLPDARPPRYAEGVTSASAHPELVSGDLAIAPRRHVPIMALNRSVASGWRPAMGGLAALAAIVLLVSALSLRSGTTTLADGDADKQRFARTCMQWHLAAGAVVGRLVQSTRDADLVRVNDSVFRMRRARRNCEAGWVALACQDYHAVAAGLPGYAMTHQLFPCAQYATVSPAQD